MKKGGAKSAEKGIEGGAKGTWGSQLLLQMTWGVQIEGA